MVKNSKYNFSFTGASALVSETLVIAEEYARLKDWSKVKKSVEENNLISKIKTSTAKRMFQEIKKRLELLSPNQMELLIHGSLEDAKAMILLSLAKTYTFFKDFIVEIVRNKYLLFDNALSEVDYSKFFNTKSLSHAELTNITEVTAKKVNQVVFKLLEQVGLITQAKNGTIVRPVLSNKALSIIIEDDPSLLMAFLYSNEEIKALLQKLKHA